MFVRYKVWLTRTHPDRASSCQPPRLSPAMPGLAPMPTNSDKPNQASPTEPKRAQPSLRVQPSFSKSSRAQHSLTEPSLACLANEVGRSGVRWGEVWGEAGRGVARLGGVGRGVPRWPKAGRRGATLGEIWGLSIFTLEPRALLSTARQLGHRQARAVLANLRIVLNKLCRSKGRQPGGLARA